MKIRSLASPSVFMSDAMPTHFSFGKKQMSHINQNSRLIYSCYKIRVVEVSPHCWRSSLSW